MDTKLIHILLVEDDEAHAELIRRAFEFRSDIKLEVKHSLQQALKKIRDFVPDLVISDLRLPDGEGIELLSKEKHSSYPVIIMTSHGDEKVAVETMKAGALDYIVKTDASLIDMPRISDRAIREWNHIKERKQAEEELAKTNEKLKSMNEELKKTQAQLIQSAKLASLGEMATGIAHELNQPLAAISLNAEMMLEFLAESTKAEFEGSYHTIIEQVERASKIINHLKIFGRKTGISERKEISISAIILNSFKLLKEPLRLQNICVTQKIEENLPPIFCNSIQIEQVLTNLLVNAKDASESCRQKSIVVEAFQSEESIIVEVTDNGEGIEEEILERIFDPFFTTKEIGKGTGLGLSISYGIIKDHQGSIEVESQKGIGTTFRVKLPTSQQKDKMRIIDEDISRG